MKADLHIHTTFSDGAASPKEVVEAALEKNINCICITDHNEIKGAIEAMRFGFDKDILVIPGIEITTKFGDILGINIKNKIPKNLSFKEIIREIRKQDGLAVAAHPFVWSLKNHRKRKKNLIWTLDAIEVFNASWLRFFNKKALKISQKYDFPFTAGSDAHKAKFIGRGYIETPKNICSARELIEEIKEKRITARVDPLTILETTRNNMVRGIICQVKDFFT